MSIQIVSNNILAQPASAPRTEAPKAPATPAKPENKSALDTFTQTLGGAVAGAQATGLAAAAGAGVMSFISLKEAPAFHRVLLSTLNASSGAIAGLAVGGISGAVAGAVADSKSGGAAIGAATGAVAGAAALTALSLKSGKGLDIKMLAGGAALGAALGAIGGFASAAVKNQ